MSLLMRRKGVAALLAAVLACGLGALRAAGAPQYGTMAVEAGSVTIVREGKSLVFQKSPAAVVVNEQDTVRVREGSRAVLTTAEQARVTFGSNAIFTCNPWKAPKKTGVLRLLYGRMYAVVQGLGPDQSFNVKTVEAVIGVKGTGYGAIQTSRGKTMVLGKEHMVTLSGSDDVDQPVGPDHFSSVAPGQPSTPSFEASDALKDAIANLDAPPPNAPGAANLPTFEYHAPQDVLLPNLDDAQQAGARRHAGVILRFNP